jgi:uncharacterized protein (TIGR02145 family)
MTAKKLLILLIGIIISFTNNSCSDNSEPTNSNQTNSSVVDIDGNTYQLVSICNQTWTKSNLNVSKYNNGDPIPQVTDPYEWRSLTTGAWCYYNNDSSNGAVYGKLYNWYAVNDSRGLAPVGYHIPSVTEWSNMINCLDTSNPDGGAIFNIAGGKLKEIGTLHWSFPNLGATNETGFTGLPGGWRSNIYQFPSISFNEINYKGFWWTRSSHIQSSSVAWYYILDNEHWSASKQYGPIKLGYSVRCIKD